MKNPLEVLGITRDMLLNLSDTQIQKVINSQKRVLLGLYHPDKGGNKRKFIEINNAAEILEDKLKFHSLRRELLSRKDDQFKSKACEEKISKISNTLKDYITFNGFSAYLNSFNIGYKLMLWDANKYITNLGSTLEHNVFKEMLIKNQEIYLNDGDHSFNVEGKRFVGFFCGNFRTLKTFRQINKKSNYAFSNFDDKQVTYSGSVDIPLALEDWSVLFSNFYLSLDKKRLSKENLQHLKKDEELYVVTINIDPKSVSKNDIDNSYLNLEGRIIDGKILE